jgi:hypothetical protein
MELNESAARVPLATRRVAQRCRTARRGDSHLLDRLEGVAGAFPEMARLRQVLAQAFPVDAVLLLGSLGDVRQSVDAVAQRPDLPDVAADMLRASLSRLQRVIDEVQALMSTPGVPTTTFTG